MNFFQLSHDLATTNLFGESAAIAIAAFSVLWLTGLLLTPTKEFRRSDSIIFWTFSLWSTFAGIALCFSAPKILGINVIPSLALFFTPMFIFISKLKWEMARNSTSKKRGVNRGKA